METKGEGEKREWEGEKEARMGEQEMRREKKTGAWQVR